MAIYRYQHESLVDTVHVLMNEKGGLRAYLYADNGKDSERLRLLKQALRGEGYKCVPTLNDGKPVMEVRGFEKTDTLIKYLDHLGAITGKPEIVAEESDKRTTKVKLEGATLKMAGFSYNVGDASYLFYTAGPLLKDWKALGKESRFFGIIDVIGGIGYGLGSLCLSFFGAKDQSINTIRSATSQIERFARKEGYAITPESSIAFANTDPKRGVVDSVKKTLGRYPSEALNSIYVGVGLCLSAAAFHRATRPLESLISFKTLEASKNALKSLEENVVKDLPQIEAAAEKLLEDKKAYGRALKSRKMDKIDIGLGAVTATSAIVGLAVKEQKRMDGDPKRHGIGRVIDWIREKPLRATGYGYMIATAFHAYATHGKWKEGEEEKKYLIGRVIFIAANVVSEILLTLSSKGHGIGVKPDSSINDSVISAAAELVLRQPQEKREAIISQLSGYIASPEVLAIKAEEVEKSIRRHIVELANNSWTKHYVPNANGVMVEAAPEQIVQAATMIDQPTAPVVPDLSKLTAAPSTVVSNAEHIAKHQEIAHAVA